MERTWFENLSMLSYASVCEEKYFPALNFNGFFKVGEDDINAEMIGEIPDEKRFSKYLYSAVEFVDGKIYMAPMNAKDIAVYEIESGKIFKIKLKQEYMSITAKFFRILRDDYFLYLIPSRYPAIVKINLKNNNVTYLDSWINKLNIGTEIFVKNGCFLKNGIINIALFEENKVLKINTETQMSQLLEIPTNNKQGFVDMFYDNDCYWFIQKGSTAVVKYYDKIKKTEYIYIDDSEEHKSEIPYIRILDYGDKILLAAYYGKRSVIIDKKTCEIQDINDFEKSKEIIFEDSWDARFYYAEQIEQDKVLLGSIPDHQCLVLDINKNSIVKTFFIKNKNSSQMYKEYLLATNEMKETKAFDLDDFCEYLEFYEEIKWNKPLRNLCGEHIHKVISGLMN